jgi:2-iminobutanoate/2-iminopropanoate deaminase
MSADERRGAPGGRLASKPPHRARAAGQIGIVPGTKDFASPDVEGQAEQVLKNMGAILEAAGASYKSVVKTTILLADIGDVSETHEHPQERCMQPPGVWLG